jgi:hypothetical protein
MNERQSLRVIYIFGTNTLNYLELFGMRIVMVKVLVSKWWTEVCIVEVKNIYTQGQEAKWKVTRLMF